MRRGKGEAMFDVKAIREMMQREPVAITNRLSLLGWVNGDSFLCKPCGINLELRGVKASVIGIKVPIWADERSAVHMRRAARPYCVCGSADHVPTCEAVAGKAGAP